MPKMNRFTAYESSVSPMSTWNVRGRSSSHTPDPASTPMAIAIDDLHQIGVLARAGSASSLGERARPLRGLRSD